MPARGSPKRSSARSPAAEVDLCVLTGDFRNAERGPFTQTEILEPLAAIRQSVRAADGFFVTLGNHDVATWWRRSAGSACTF